MNLWIGFPVHQQFANVGRNARLNGTGQVVMSVRIIPAIYGEEGLR